MLAGPCWGPARLVGPLEAPWMLFGPSAGPKRVLPPAAGPCKTKKNKIYWKLSTGLTSEAGEAGKE